MGHQTKSNTLGHNLKQVKIFQFVYCILTGFEVLTNGVFFLPINARANLKIWAVLLPFVGN